MEVTVAVAATVGSPFAPHDGADRHDLVDSGSVRVTGYPVGGGWVGETLTEEGGPAAVVLLMAEPALPDQSVRARAVALVHALVDGQPRTEVLCVPAHDPNFAALTDAGALRAWHADEAALSAVLHRLDPAHRWRVADCEDAAAAEAFLAEARHCYERLTGCLE
ncbi:inorganic diphosphatase [Streptomyces sp. LP11]|uniref:inorganic diphosphatase n=1 Tax=Streptomyces pyxinicus TaxID=2970331 RepID=A0ABT2B5A1_9ACTN|nr:inorganic diphosphatase [Streptomyces sp. LP11]MCS0603697.1 inorganic diphosphatase [Streptomyces sp. LP11]